LLPPDLLPAAAAGFASATGVDLASGAGARFESEVDACFESEAGARFESEADERFEAEAGGGFVSRSSAGMFELAAAAAAFERPLPKANQASKNAATPVSVGATSCELSSTIGSP